MNCTSHSCDIASKKLRISASSTQFTFFVAIPTVRAHPTLGAGCAPGPKSVREAEEVLLVDHIQYLDDGALDDLVFQHRHPQRALPARRLSV